MLRRFTRWAAVPVMTLLAGVGTVLGAAPAEAVGSCWSPLPMTGVTAGVLDDSNNYEDYWSYQAAGTTTFRLVDASTYMYVWTSGCGSYLCGSTSTCTINYNGPVVVQVYNQSTAAAYVLAATSTAAPSGPCNRVNTTGVCVDLTAGNVVQSETVYNVTTTPAATHTVGGWVDAYRFALSTGGSVVAPCVVLNVNTTSSNPCASAGGTFVNRTATLVSQSVTQPRVVQGASLATVRVCQATLTATVAGFGVEQFPAYSTC